MATDLLTDLERLGDLLQRISDPITLDQICEHPAVSLDQPPVDIEAEVGVAPATDEIGLVALYRSMTDHASRRRVVAAMVAAAAVVGALWLATWRSGAETGVGDPIQETTAVSPVPGVADGRVTFDAVPAGWRLNGASDAPGSAGSDAFVQRIYATADPAPENQPALVLTSFAEGAESPNVADSAESLSVQGVDGHMFPSAGGGQSLVFGPVDGFRYLLIGYHVSRAELVAATPSPLSPYALQKYAGWPWTVMSITLSKPNLPSRDRSGSAKLRYQRYPVPLVQ